MLKILRSIWIWAATAVIVLFWVPLLFIVRLTERDPLRRRTARWFRRLGPAVAKVNPAWNVIVSGQENIVPGQVYVVVSNHQSLADIPLVAHLAVEAKWLAKAELFRFPIFGWMMRISKDISVEREDRRKAAQALLQCARALKQKLSIITFPEGTRSRTGEIMPFADGPFQLAVREQVPVLPVVVEGTGTALPRASWVFGPVQDIHLSVLAPVSASEFQNAAGLRDTVREHMIEHLSRLRTRS